MIIEEAFKKRLSAANMSPALVSIKQIIPKSRGTTNLFIQKRDFGTDFSDMQLFSDWVLEPGDGDNAVTLYQPSDLSEHWPEVLRECYGEWIALVHHVQEVLEEHGEQVHDMPEDHPAVVKYERIESFYNYLLKAGELHVNIGEKTKVSWSFARLGPFGDPVEFRAVVRHCKLQDDPDLGESIKEYDDQLGTTVRFKDDIAEKLLLDIIDFRHQRAEIHAIMPELECREMLVRATLNSEYYHRRQPHDLHLANNLEASPEILNEQLGLLEEKNTARRTKYFELAFRIQTRTAVTNYLRDFYRIDIAGMRELLEGQVD